MTEDLEDLVGGKFAFEADAAAAAELMVAHIDRKREALKLRPMMYETAPASLRPTRNPWPPPEQR